MRDPYKAAQANPNLMSLSLRIRAAWESFVKQYSGATKVAETYGTPHCSFDDWLIGERKSKLKKVGAQAPPSSCHQRQAEVQEPTRRYSKRGKKGATTRRRRCRNGSRNGAPLGIEAENPHAIAEVGLMDAQAQLAKGEISNYKSVAEDIKNAAIELDRYKKEWYLVELTKEEVLDTMSHGTISRLGLIVKEKPEGAPNHHRPTQEWRKRQGHSPREAGAPKAQRRLEFRERSL